jgi:hypothetical protein
MIGEQAPIEVEVTRSPIDGALVVQVDTTGDTGRVRINLNDGAVWDGDPEQEQSAFDLLREIADRVALFFDREEGGFATAILLDLRRLLRSKGYLS